MLIFNLSLVAAGLADLTLANSLKKQGIPFEVYEREASADARTQGWSLSIHFALAALKQCVPEEEFENFSQKVPVNPESVDGGTSFSFLNANTGQVQMSNTAKPGISYRVSRYRFRNWLLKQVEDKVHWNKQVRYYQENTEEGTVTAFFEDGTQVTGDVLVGTDGVQSPVARQLLGGKEKFDELTNVIQVRAFDVLTWATEEEWVKIADGPTHLCVLNGQQIEDDDIKKKTFNMFCSIHNIDRSRPEKPLQVFWSLSRYDPEGVNPKYNDNNNAECLDLMKAWAHNATNITPLVVRERVPISELLEAPKRRVVLVGDAAYPMTMFKGEVGNNAIVDAANLGSELGHYYQGTKSLDEALSASHSDTKR